MEGSTRPRRVTEGTVNQQIDEENEEGPRSFAHQIGTMCEGEVNLACSTELHDLLLHLRHEAQARCKKVKGTFKLELTIEVTDDDIVGIAHSIKVKAPEPRRRAAIMWLSPGGNLTPENPRQQTLPGLREVPGGRNESPREVAPGRAPAKEI